MADSSTSSQGPTALPTSIPALVAWIKLAPHEPLVASAHSLGTIATLASAVRALWRLSYNDPANQLQIAASGGISPLAQLLSYTQHQDLLQAACGCLWSLAANTKLHATVGNSGAIPLLVQLLQGEYGTSATLEQAAGLLNILSSNSAGNCRQIALTGGVTAVVRILCAPMSTDNTRQYSASTLCNLALADPNNQKFITAAGGVMAILPLLRPDVSSPPLLGQAVLTLKILALDADNQTIIAALGGIPILTNILSSSPSASVLWSAAGALRNIICDHVINQATLVAAPGALATVVRVLQDKTHPQSVLQQTAAVLTCLACNPALHQALLAEPGCATALLQLLDPSTSCPATLETAATAIGLLSTNPPAQPILRRVGAISILARLLGNSACTEELYKSVGSALVNLGHNNPSRQAAIRGAGAIGIITQLLKQARSAGGDKPQLSDAAITILQQLLSMLQSNLSKQSAPVGDPACGTAAVNADGEQEEAGVAAADGDATGAVDDLTTGLAHLYPAARQTAAAKPVVQDGFNSLAGTAADLADAAGLAMDQDDTPVCTSPSTSPAAVSSTSNRLSRHVGSAINGLSDADASSGFAALAAASKSLPGRATAAGCHKRLTPTEDCKDAPHEAGSSSSSGSNSSTWTDVVKMQPSQQQVTVDQKRVAKTRLIQLAAGPHNVPADVSSRAKLSWSNIVQGGSSLRTVPGAAGSSAVAGTTPSAATAHSALDDPWSIPSFNNKEELSPTLSGDQDAIPGPGAAPAAAPEGSQRTQMCLVCRACSSTHCPAAALQTPRALQRLRGQHAADGSS